ncbi:AraC family transcriptional regulator [Chitinophaga sp. 30R24]|uniref:AraC family transcriptional regulator n=1 Tax=Chitinophaga sp. 30R24 TaxID=3248838 RepID=UPI003B8FD261
MQKIPLHKLYDRADIGLEVRHTSHSSSKSELEAFGVHRDDNYIFLLVEKGAGSIVVDFQQVLLTERNVYFVSPGQIHHRINAGNSDSWYLSVAPMLVPADCLDVFESNLLSQQPCMLEEAAFMQCQQTIQLLSTQYYSDPQAAFYKQQTYALLNAFLCVVARAYLTTASEGGITSRPFLLTRAFRKLLTERVTEEKSPTFYARQLHISEIYLNEVVKKITGFTVTHWIMHEIILEAKRLLCYSNMNVKEIAHLLGYEDHTYFSRLFKKVTQTTPLVFRTAYLK